MAESLPKWQIRHNLQPNSILFNFPCIALRFNGQKQNFSQFVSLFFGPCFDRHDHQMYILKKKNKQKNSWFCSQLYGLFLHPWKWAKYTHLDKSIPVWQQLWPRIRTSISWCFKCNVFFFINCKGTFQRYERFFACSCSSPPPPLDPGCHFDMFCECAKRTCWQKGMLGHGGGGGGGWGRRNTPQN